MQGEDRQKSGAYLIVCEHFVVIFNAAVGVSDDAITEFLGRVEVIIEVDVSKDKSRQVVLTLRIFNGLFGEFYLQKPNYIRKIKIPSCLGRGFLFKLLCFKKTGLLRK